MSERALLLLLSVLTAIFPGKPGMMEVVMTTGAIRRAKLQSVRHHHQTNTQFLQAGCPSCCWTNSVKALKWKSITSHGHAHSKLTWVFQQTLKAPGYLGESCQAAYQPSDASARYRWDFILSMRWNKEINSQNWVIHYYKYRFLINCWPENVWIICQYA